MKRISRPTLGFIAGITGALIAAVLVQFSPLRAAPESRTPKIVVHDTPVNRDSKGTLSYANVIKKVAPSVVTIYSTRQVNVRMNRMFDDPSLRRYFGEPFGDQEQPRRYRHTEEGLGSG